MKTCFRLLAGACALVLSTASWADSPRPAHAKGEPSATTQQAVTNLNEYNPKLEALLAKDELTAMDLHEVHMLTYTLENALRRIQADLESTAALLEEVHIASETNKPDVVKARGQAYLQGARALVE